MESSKGAGFIAATFLQGKTIMATGDLWEHESFSRQADSAWISPSVSTSTISVPVRWGRHGSTEAIDGNITKRDDLNQLPLLW